MNPKAISDSIPYVFTSVILVKPSPLTPKAPRQYGPTKIPATKYAVTAGNFKSFATRESIKPANIAIDKLSNACIYIPPIKFYFPKCFQSHSQLIGIHSAAAFFTNDISVQSVVWLHVERP